LIGKGRFEGVLVGVFMGDEGEKGDGKEEDAFGEDEINTLVRVEVLVGI
jgi:hypothetical protein